MEFWFGVFSLVTEIPTPTPRAHCHDARAFAKSDSSRLKNAKVRYVGPIDAHTA